MKRKMTRLQDLVAADFPDCDPKKFEAWKRAELSFQRQRGPRIFKIGVAIMFLILMFAVPLVRYWSGVPLALGVRLTIAGVPAVSLWLSDGGHRSVLEGLDSPRPDMR
jgi:hypothetical protein